MQPTLIHWIGLLSPHNLRGRLFGGLTSILFLGQFASPLFMQPLLGNGMSLGNTFGYFGLAGMGATIFMIVVVLVTGKVKNINLEYDSNFIHSESEVYEEDA